MTKKTPNAERRTPNVKFGKWRVAEVSNGEYSARRNPAYDLEDIRLVTRASSAFEVGCSAFGVRRFLL